MDFELARICAALGMFGVAAVLDMRDRQVDDRLWMVFGAIAIAFYFFDFSQLDILAVALSVGLAGAASFLLYRTGLFGGADALALVVFSVILPTYDGRFIAIAPSMIHNLAPLMLLSNAVLLSLARLLANVAKNAWYGVKHQTALFAGMESETAARKALAVLLGHRSDGAGFAFLMESRHGGMRRFDFSLKNAEETPFESRKGVWVMPGMPFLVYMLAGFVAMILGGDLAMLFLSGLAGNP